MEKGTRTLKIDVVRVRTEPVSPSPLPGTATYPAVLLAITTAALIARTLGLGSAPPLWQDEGFTGELVRRSVPAMLDVVRHDNHPPLEYLLVRVVAVFSTTPAALRLASALVGTVAVPMAAALGRRLAGNRGGLLAALVVASQPAFLAWSRDARMYSLAMTLVLASALALWRAAEEPSPVRLLAYSACVAGAVYTHYFALLATLCQMVLALLLLCPDGWARRRLAAAWLVGTLTLVPWLVLALPQFQHMGSRFWIQTLTLGSLLPLLLGTSWPVAIYPWVMVVMETGLVAVFLRRSGGGRRPALAFLAGASLLPTLALFLAGFWKPVFDPRYVTIFWGPGMALIGASLTGLRSRLVAVVACLLLVTNGLTVLTIQRVDFARLLATVERDGRPGDVVIVNGPHDYWSVAYWLDGSRVDGVHVLSRDNVAWYNGTAGYGHDTVVHSVPDVSGRIYLVTPAGTPDPVMPPGFHVTARTCQRDVCLETFSRN